MIGWIPADWPAPPGIVAGCTTRAGGVSTDSKFALNLGAHVGDAPEAVIENRRRVVNDLELRGEPLWLNQIHGRDVVDADATVSDVPTADASVSSRAGQALAIMTADCLPVLFCSKDGKRIAAAHAGWRGLAAGVLEKTLETMNTERRDVLCWLGPAISASAYEVGGEVRDAFLKLDPGFSGCFAENDRGRWQADIAGIARLKLTAAGVTTVSGGDFCTFGDAERFYSHRRDPTTGRQASIIVRR